MRWTVLALLATGLVALLFSVRDPGARSALRAPAPASRPVAPPPLGGTRIAGDIVSAVDGKPVPDARLFVLATWADREDDEEPEGNAVYRPPAPPWPRLTPLRPDEVVASSDAAGAFVFRWEGGAGLVGELLALAPGYEPARETVPLAAGGIALRFELRPASVHRLRVVDERGEPIAGAEVLGFVRVGAPPHVRAVTDACGEAPLTLSEDGEWTASAPGRAREWGRCSSERSGEEMEIRLSPGYRLSGRVVDTEGRPMPGVGVRLREGTGCVIRSAVDPVRGTDARGRFAFDHVGDWHSVLQVDVEGFVPVHHVAVPGDARVEIVLPRPATISGTVLDALDRPVVDAVVEPSRVPYYETMRFRVRTDERGAFRLQEVLPGANTLRVWASEGECRIRVQVDEGEAREGIVLRLEREVERFVSLRVLDPSGAPIRARYWDRTEGVTGEDGIARLRVSSPRPRVTLDPGRPLPPHRVELQAATEPESVDVRVPAYALATFLVRNDEGNAPGVEGLELQLHVGPPADHLPWALPDAGRSDPFAGRFAFRVNPEVEYLCTVRGPGLALARKSWQRPADGSPTELRVSRLGGVRGRLVDAEGRAVPGAWVSVREQEGARARAGADGSFLLEGLRPGEVTFQAGREAGPEVARVVVVTPHAHLDLGDVVLRGRREIRGRVVDGAGRPLGGATLYRIEGGGYYQEALSHADGGFRFDAPAEWASLVFVRKTGYGLVAIDPAAAPSVVTLAPGGAVRLVPRGAEDLEGFAVEARVAVVGGARVWCPAFWWDRWNARPFENLPAGEVQLRLLLARPIECTALVRAGEMTDLVVDLGK